MANTERYIVEGRNMDGIYGYYVVDTQHELYKVCKDLNMHASHYTHGLSMKKQDMIKLAEKLNKEAE